MFTKLTIKLFGVKTTTDENDQQESENLSFDKSRHPTKLSFFPEVKVSTAIASPNERQFKLNYIRHNVQYYVSRLFFRAQISVPLCLFIATSPTFSPTLKRFCC